MAIEVVNQAVSFRSMTKPEVKPAEVKSSEAVQAAEPKQSKIVHTAKASTEQESQEQDNGQTNQKHIQNVINEANVKMKQAKTKCEFSYHEATKRVSIKIIDQDTNEVIREVPPEETLKMIEKIWELTGIMVDEKR